MDFRSQAISGGVTESTRGRIIERKPYAQPLYAEDARTAVDLATTDICLEQRNAQVRATSAYRSQAAMTLNHTFREGPCCMRLHSSIETPENGTHRNVHVWPEEHQ